MKSEIWIFAEQQNARVKSVTAELLSEGRKLADSLQVALCAVCLGHHVEGVEQLIAHGADRVYLVDDPGLASNDEDLYTKALADLARQHKPEILLAAATSLGRSFIPRVAVALQTGLAAECVGLGIDPSSGLLLQTRPAYGGNLMATIACSEKRPQMATVRPHTFKRGRPDEARRGEIIRVDLDKQAVTSRTRLLQMVNDLTDKVKLEEADIIVCGGRGLGAPDNFRLVTELAEVLGAAVGSSRPPVDDGWIPYSCQIGQTGKTVAPRVYFACGISGAPQHLAGMQTSDIIVAINEDPKAPIFEVATYGIVGDLFKVLPLLTAKLKEARG